MEIKFQPSNPDPKFEYLLFFYFIIVFLIYNLPSSIAATFIVEQGFDVGGYIEKIYLPLLFIISNTLLSAVLRRHILVRSALMVFLGAMMSIIQFYFKPGIIDSVYYFILSATCAVLLGFYKGQYLNEELTKISEFNDITEKIIDSIRDGYKYILARTFQGWLGLGASLGVSMSILFKNGYDDLDLKFSALKMLLGFICISISIGFWVALPALNGIVNVHHKLESFAKERVRNELIGSNNR